MSKVWDSFKSGSKSIARALGYDEVVPQLKKKPGPGPIADAPLEDADAIRRARRKSLAAQAARSGRASTILSSSDERLGD
jgi:hypothetical protein